MSSPSSNTLSGIVWPGEAFTRATNVELDFRDPTGVPEYRFSTRSMRLLEDLLDSCGSGRRDRAWALVGPYGSGKSTFGLFLLQLLTGSETGWVKRCLSQLGILDPSLASRISNDSGAGNPAYVPIVLQGSAVPLDLALCRALYAAATDNDRDTSWASNSFRSSVLVALQTLEAGTTDSRHTAELFRQAAELASLAGYRGLVVLVDEFGKFLERAAWQGEVPDILAAQYLAELASSLPESKVLFLVLLHQGFQHYASSLSENQRLEWVKIQGRFRQVDLSEDPDNLYDLIASSLDGSHRHGDMDAEITSWAERVWDEVKAIPAFSGEGRQDLWQNLLPRVYPFHPLALYALPRLSARLGQNQRSLFTFLGSEEPLALKRFLSNTACSPGGLPSLALDQVFDYFFTSTSFTSIPPDVQRNLSEVNAALDRLGDATPLNVRLLKTIGALTILRDSPGLPANLEVLAAALQADSGPDRADLHRSLESLVARKILVFRKFSGEYRIWQGTDFDFDGALRTAREEIKADFDLSQALEQHLSPLPTMAYRHSFETGTSRHFSTQFFPSRQLLEIDDQQLDQLVEESRADGLIIHGLPANWRDHKDLKDWAKSVNASRVVVCLPGEPVSLENLAQESTAMRRISALWPEILDDPVAVKELAARVEGVEELLKAGIQLVAEPAQGRTFWYWQGRELPIYSRRDLNALLSTVCDAVYHLTPRIRNELVNRRHLSTAAVIAVKRVIGGLLAADGPNLEFEGNGPEVSIVQAVFRRTGIYTGGDLGKQALHRPDQEADPGLSAVWDYIEEFFRASNHNGPGMDSLIMKLAEPPFGIRLGLIPLLIWSVMIYHRNSLCLYENGTYVRQWSPENYDLFVKVPKPFSVRWLVFSGTMAMLIRGLNKAIPDAPKLANADVRVPLSSVLQHLFDWYQGLPDYAKHTTSLSTDALEVRRAITTAVDPIDLILIRIPKALNLQDMSAGGVPLRHHMKEYLARFANALMELSSAYVLLQNQMVASMASALGTPPIIAKVRGHLEEFDPITLEHVRDPMAKAFLIRARAGESNDAQWLESLGATLSNQAPRYWTDHHREEFNDKIALVALSVSDAQRRSYARREWGAEVRRIIVEQPGEETVDEFLRNGEETSELAEAAQAVLRFLDVSAPGASPSEVRQVLAHALQLAYKKRNNDEGGSLG